jgi:hypothetical protein
VKSLYHRTLSALREELTQEAPSVRGWTPKPERVAYNNRASRKKDDL